MDILDLADIPAKRVPVMIVHKLAFSGMPKASNGNSPVIARSETPPSPAHFCPNEKNLDKNVRGVILRVRGPNETTQKSLL
jgi:hypothetical protein